MGENRIELVKDLALLNGDISEISKKLSAHEWDFEGIPFLLKAEHVEGVLRRFLSGSIDAAGLEIWADAVEMREDIQFEATHEDWIRDTITTLSSSQLNGPITVDSVTSMLEAYKDR